MKKISPHYSPTVRTLPNGLTVVYERLPYLRTVSVGVWVRAGSGFEPAERAGISHFLEHLFFKGTESRTARDIMDAIERRGGQLNAFTSREYTCFYAKMLDTHVSVAIEVLGDILKNSTYTDLEKERNVILEEIASSMDVPEDYVHDLLTGQIWPGHALGRPIAGSMETVAGIRLEHIRRYKAQWYRPQNMCVTIAGNMDEEAVLAQIEAEFGGLDLGTAAQVDGTPTPACGVQCVERDIAQNHIAFAFPGASAASPDRYAYDILCSIIGGGSTSRLFERIREDEGLAYAVYAFNATYRETGLLGVYAAIAPENLERAIGVTRAELQKLKSEPVNPEELSSNAEQLKGGLLMGLESTFHRMSHMARSLMYFGRIREVEDILADIDAVTAEDVRSLAERTFSEEHCAMTVLGPVNGRQMAAPV